MMDEIIDLLNHRLTFWVVLLLFLFAILSNSVHIAQEGERFAKFIFGKFARYEGPGLVLSSPSIAKLYRLRVGLVGRLVGPEYVEFEGVQFPIKKNSDVRIGEFVQIVDFDEDGPVLTTSREKPKAICPKCQHVF